MKVYIALPLMYYNYDFNYKLQKFILKNKQKQNEIFKIPNIRFSMAYGNLPFAIWNGGINLNIPNQDFLTYSKIQNFFAEGNLPIRIDCSNLFINSEDKENGYQNLILEQGNNMGNFIEITDLGLLEYIQNLYPNYDFIFSKNAHLVAPFTLDIINSLTEQNIFYLINLPTELSTNNKLLSNIKNKDHIEINIGSKCNLNCPNLNTCAQQEQKYLINYSEKTIYYNCKKMNNYCNEDELYNEIMFFTDLGFNHFKIDTPPINKIQEFNLYLIMNLFKKEYQLPYIMSGEINNNE